MDTPIWARYALLFIIFAGVIVIGLANLRLLLRLALRRKTTRAERVVWPALALLVAFCIVDATRIEPNWIQVTHHTFEAPTLPPGSRLRIVQLADIHLAKMGSREMAMLTKTAAQHPDVIVLTGDHSVIKDATTQRSLTQLAKRLSKIAPTYAIEGNWDIAADMRALEQGGVTVLDGWTVVPGRNGAEVALGHVSWLPLNVAEVPKWCSACYKVALCHMPHLFDSAAERGVDLMLAGHTHGGQVRLPIFGALLPERTLVGKYQAGVYNIGDRHLYISRGIGMEGGAAPKVRFWCRPEVAVVDIVGKNRQTQGE